MSVWLPPLAQWDELQRDGDSPRHRASTAHLLARAGVVDALAAHLERPVTAMASPEVCSRGRSLETDRRNLS